MKFVSLHHHTSFSTGDGHGSPEEHVLRAKELGMTAMALTEHGNTSSHVQLEQAALKHGIKPIFGVEAYVAKPGTKSKFHQTILAMNEDGYRQLNRMVTKSWIKNEETGEGFYMRPTVNFEQLFDSKETSDLIVLSGCASSLLSQSITGSKSFGAALPMNKLLKIVEKYQSTFGDRFYLELQHFHDYDRTHKINQAIEEIAAETGIPVVGTADVHYPRFEDWEINQVANAIGWGTTVEALEKGDRKYDSLPGQTFPESDEQFVDSLVLTGVGRSVAVEALKETEKVAERCNVTLPKTDPVRYSEGDGTPEDAIRLLNLAIAEGAKYRKETSEEFAQDWDERKDEYIARIRKELDVIQPKDFSDYFLINKQIIGWAKDSGIAVGPARGSAAASLVCYLLRITEINPMMYPMMIFERFLDPGREDDPDIDTDYQDDRRHEVFDYAREVYGDHNVGNIGNFGRYRGKSAIKSVAKAYGIPVWEAEGFGDYIAEAPSGDAREYWTAEDAAEAFPEAKEFIEDNPGMERAFRLEGDMKSLGVHAAGMVISNLPISETCAIYEHTKTNGEKTEVIAYDKRDAAYLNMLKLDCLGLLTMTIIADVVDMVPELDMEKLYAMPRDHEEVYRAFADDDLTGIFQFEGRATRQVVRDIYTDAEGDKLPDFMDLADINALSRPGSLMSGMTTQYIKVARGQEEPKSIHPVVDEILSETKGCLVYQEQVMAIGKQFGGLDDTEIGRLRKIIGAKQAGGAFEEFWIKFRDGAARLHDAPEDLSRQVWNYMAASATYLFNVAHAISYAAVAYWTMYLKIHYPAEFFAASLRSAAKKGKQKGKVDPQLPILQDAVRHGLTVSPPHPHNSSLTWKPNEERTGVIAGFTQLPNVGPRVAEAMYEYRQHQEALSWDDMKGFVRGFGNKTAENAKNFCRMADPFGINLTNDAIYTVRENLKDGSYGLMSPDAHSGTIPDQEGQVVAYVGHVIAVKVIDVIGEMRQRENLTTDEAIARLKKPELATKAKIICSDTGGTEVHVNVSRYTYPKVKEEIDVIDPKQTYAVHVVGTANNGFGPSVQADKLTAIELVEEI